MRLYHVLFYDHQVRMYQKYSERNSWKFSLVSSSEVFLLPCAFVFSVCDFSLRIFWLFTFLQG